MKRTALLCLYAWLGLWGSGPARAQVIEIERAQFLLSNTATPPPASAPGWEERAIPDDWRKSQGGAGGTGWYRVTFNLDSVPSEPWAVLINHKGAAYVNDVPVGGAVELQSHRPAHFLPPRLYPIEPGLLRPGPNELLIGISAHPGTQLSGMFGAWVGPERNLRPRFQFYRFVKVTACEGTAMAEFIIAAIFGLLWLQRRDDSLYGWFALACAVWALRAWLLVIRDGTVDDWIWSWLVDADAAAMFATGLLVSHRYFGIRRPMLEWPLLGVAAFVLLSLPFYPQLNRGWLLVLQWIPYYLLALGIQRARLRSGAEELAFSLGAMAWALTALYDIAAVYGILPFRTTWVFAHFGSLVLALIMAWMMINRFVRALGIAETTSAELARQVEEKRRELDASYKSVEELRQRQAVTSERERIMRDLHDGLGGQLVAALALSQGEDASKAAVTQTLREALDDLRMVIDSLEPTEGDLLVLLGSVRTRLESRLQKQGLRFDWRVQDIPEMPGFGPDKALQVLRIVQEAITNVVKHSGARTITVSTGLRDRSVFVQIGDDGAGFRKDGPEGRGLENMRQRAARIGGALDVDSGAHGTIVRLSLPLAGTT